MIRMDQTHDTKSWSKLQAQHRSDAISRQAVITFSTVSCPLAGSWQPLRAVASVRKPEEREEAGGRRMGEPLIAGPVPSTAAGATHA